MSLWKISTYALTLALGAAAGASLMPRAHADEQPRMHSALEHLKAAKRALESASPDKGGHRVKAIQATVVAIKETEAGIDFDNKHPDHPDKPGHGNGPSPKPPNGPEPKPPTGPTPKGNGPTPK
jgi:hypothetical protein